MKIKLAEVFFLGEANQRRDVHIYDLPQDARDAIIDLWMKKHPHLKDPHTAEDDIIRGVESDTLLFSAGVNPNDEDEVDDKIEFVDVNNPAKSLSWDPSSKRWKNGSLHSKR